MKSEIKLLTLLLMVFSLSFFSCKKEIEVDPTTSTEIQDNATQAVEDDLKAGEPLDKSKNEKGDLEYCDALKKKMAGLKKDSKEMDACYKLYKFKCTDCKKDSLEGKCDWDKKEIEYCKELNTKLLKVKKGSDEYLEIQKLIKLKCK